MRVFMLVLFLFFPNSCQERIFSLDCDSRQHQQRQYKQVVRNENFSTVYFIFVRTKYFYLDFIGIL